MSTAAKVHKDIAREAGFGSISAVSVIAGVFAAYGAFAIVAAIAGAILTSLDVQTEFRSNDWTGSGATAGLITAGVLLVAYLFGGYVAGRMARRRGVLHGVLVALVSLILGGAAGALVRIVSDSAEVEQNLRSIGMPVTTDQISDVAIAGALVSLAAVLLGSIVGGHLGERWHTKLAARAADPDFGPAAAMRTAAAREQVEADNRILRDGPVAAEVAAHDVDVRDQPAEADVEPRYTAAEWQQASAQQQADAAAGAVSDDRMHTPG